MAFLRLILSVSSPQGHVRIVQGVASAGPSSIVGRWD